MNRQDFISLCVVGQATAAEIDDYIERWHKNEIGRDQNLALCLGMDSEEYDRWVRDPDELAAIITAHAARSGAA